MASSFEQLKADALAWRPQNIQRGAWAQVFLSCLTQICSSVSFPSYNTVLGFWGLYVVFTRSLQACNVYLWFLNLSLLLDVVFVSIWASNGGEIFAEVAVKFGLAMFIMNLAVKALSSYYFARLHKELVAEQLGNARQSKSARRQSLALAMAQERKDAAKKYNIDKSAMGAQEGAPMSGAGSPRSPAARSEESFELSPARY